jgi:hypothetical protein
MYEHRREPLLSRPRFILRVGWSAAASLLLVSMSLLAGMLGYRNLEQMSWTDAFLNASMLLGGMGPVNALGSQGGKIFAGFYALYCGLVVIFVAGLLLAPVLHRVLHRLHVERGNS